MGATNRETARKGALNESIKWFPAEEVYNREETAKQEILAEDTFMVGIPDTST